MSAPDPCAVLLGPQAYHWGQSSLLIIPSTDAPEASVFPRSDQWCVDTGGELRFAECGDLLRLPSGYFRLLLPEHPSAPQALTARYELDITQLSLSFRLSNEQVLVTLVQGPTEVQLPSRACLYTLGALARRRLAAGPADERAGWVSSAELAEMRNCSIEKINVDIHRLRKMFQEAGVRNASQIVERDESKRLRIGIGRLHEV
jgi:hypothetical protein